jgi:uncharacterized membrane protein YtjA (UPF0391 family)
VQSRDFSQGYRTRPVLRRALYRYGLQILPGDTNARWFNVAHFQLHRELVPKVPYQQRNRLEAALRSGRFERRTKMLYYALVFLLVAIVAAVLGFGGVAVVSAGIAKILFFVFIVLFLVSLITHMSRRV